MIGMYFAHYIFMHKVRMLGVRGTGSGGTGGVPCGPRGSSQLDLEPATPPPDDHRVGILECISAVGTICTPWCAQWSTLPFASVVIGPRLFS